MPEIRIEAPRDWRPYYEREVELRRFVPGDEPYEKDRVTLVMRLLGDLRPAAILDVGCGDGYLCQQYVEAGISSHVQGLDISTGRLRFAATLSPYARFVAGRIDRIPFRDGAFPLVSAVEVIEHIEDPVPALREVARVSYRHVLVTVPNEQVVPEALCPNCLHRFPVDGHLHTFTLADLQEICRKAGLRVIRAERYFVAAGWEKRGPFRVLGERGRAILRRALVRAGVLGEARAKYIGVLCEKPEAGPGES